MEILLKIFTIQDGEESNKDSTLYNEVSILLAHEKFLHSTITFSECSKIESIIV